ncbi:hypothetical protein FRC02_004759 [Tulasnella sp. 418]|nr:hypothetical protein FRC02_004759 [Tulasnella sp. 418]
MSTRELSARAISAALNILLANLQILGSGDNLGGCGAEKLITVEARIKLALAVFNQRVLHHITMNRRRHNELSPIGSLPPEILLLIFESSIKSQDEGIGSSRMSTLLSEVCSHWRNVVLSAPRMWNHIESCHSQTLLKIRLMRSQNTPLYIIITPDAEFETKARQYALCEQLMTHLSRWRSFVCYSSSIYALITSLWKNIPMPLLETFRVPIDDIDELQPIPSPIVNNAPSLQWLEAPQSELPSLSPTFSRLRNISFKMDCRTSWLSSPQWFSFLSTTPELEHIEVNCSNAKLVSLEAYVEEPFQVYLPRLKSLQLSDLPVSLIGLLLSSISSKHTKQVIVKLLAPWFDDKAREQYSAMFPKSTVGSSLLASIRGMTPISASYNPDLSNMRVTAGVGPEEICVDYSGHPSYIAAELDFFGKLVLPEAFANLKELKLAGPGFFDFESVSPGIEQFTTLERLIIYVGKEFGSDLEEIFDQLSSPMPSNSSLHGNISSTFACPKLRYLAVLLADNDPYPVLRLV